MDWQRNSHGLYGRPILILDSFIKNVPLFLILVLLGCGSSNGSPGKGPIDTVPAVNQTIYPTAEVNPVQKPLITLTDTFINRSKEKIIIIPSKDRIILTDPAGLHARQYSLQPNVIAASLSPDGNKIVYIREEPTDHVILVMDEETGLSNAIYKGALGGTTGTIKWSNDGNQLFFSGTVGDSLISQIYSLNINTRIMTSMTNFTGGYPDKWVSFDSWSADEETIGFTTVTMPSQSGYSQGAIQIFNVKSGQSKTLLDEKDNKDVNFIGGSWVTLDGKSVFFDGKHNGYHRIFKIDADGTHLTQVTSDQISYDISGPLTFSPDGISFFAYVADLTHKSKNGVPTLFSIDGTMIRQLTDWPGKVTSWIDN